MTALVRLLAVVLAALTLSGAAAAARVPASVSSIKVTSASGVTATVTRTAIVGQIVKWFDALPRFAVRPCPLELHYPPTVSFAFRGGDGSVLLRAVDHAPGTCSGEVESAGRTALADDGFVARVSQLLGLDLGANAKTAANERLARRDAATILRLVVLPRGNRRLARAPIEALGSAPSVPGTPALVDRHRIWKVHMPFHEVSAFEQAHPPRGGAKPAGDGFAAGPTRSTQLMFALRALHGRVSSRGLVVDIAPLAHGWTGIRVDAQDVWVVARDPDEKLPAGVRTITVRRSDTPLIRRVTARAEVALIVRWFDALPVVQPWAYHCPALRGARVTVSFRGAGGTVLATAAGLSIRGLSGPCDPIAFHVHGVAQKPFVAGHFFGRVERLAR